jgi:hypothetical protein
MDKQQLKLKNAQSRVNEEVQIHYRLRNSTIVQVRKEINLLHHKKMFLFSYLKYLKMIQIFI